MLLAFDLENNLIDLRSARVFFPENRVWEELDTIPAELTPVSEREAVTRLQQHSDRCRVPVGILAAKMRRKSSLQTRWNWERLSLRWG